VHDKYAFRLIGVVAYKKFWERHGKKVLSNVPPFA